MQGERLPRRPAEPAEDQALGAAGYSRMRLVSAGDSAPVDPAVFKIFLLRTATLQSKAGRPGAGVEAEPAGARWMAPGPTTARRPSPRWRRRARRSKATGRRRRSSINRRSAARCAGRNGSSRGKIFEAANDYAAKLLVAAQAIRAVDAPGRAGGHDRRRWKRSCRKRASRGACLLSLGWGGGLLGKSAWLDTGNQEYRDILRHLSLYSNALNSNLPFPKTQADRVPEQQAGHAARLGAAGSSVAPGLGQNTLSAGNGIFPSAAYGFGGHPSQLVVYDLLQLYIEQGCKETRSPNSRDGYFEPTRIRSSANPRIAPRSAAHPGRGGDPGAPPSRCAREARRRHSAPPPAPD